MKRKLKKSLVLLLELLLFQFCFYAEPSYIIKESELLELEQIQLQQDQQIEKLKEQSQTLINQSKNYQKIIQEQKKSFQQLEKDQLKKKIKIGGIWFGIGFTAGTLATTILFINLK